MNFVSKGGLRPIPSAHLAAFLRCFVFIAAFPAMTSDAVSADGESELRPERTLAVESYGLDEGLAQSSVISMTEDSKGFLWFGTQEGLHRFDGHRFNVLRHRPGDAESLVSSTIDVVTVDADERMWMGSNDAGIEVIDLANLQRWRFATEQGLSHLRVIDVATSPSDQSAVVATAAGVDRVDLAEQSVTNLIARDGLVGLVRFGSAGWLAADRDCRLAFSDGRVLQPKLPQMSVCVELTQAPDGTAWLATEKGDLVRIRSEDVSVITALARSSALPARVSSLYAEDDGRLLIGDSSGGVMEWHPDQPLQYSRWHIEIGSSEVSEFYRDSSGVLWIGTFTDGLHRVLPMSETVLANGGPVSSDPVNWPADIVWAIRRDADRNLLGTENGLLVQATGSNEWRQIPALAGIPVLALADRPDGGYWVGTYHGLWGWQPPGNPYPVKPDSLPDERITDLAEHEGRLWITTQSGMAVLAEGQLRPELVPAALRDRYLTTLKVDDRGFIWVGSNENGLFRFSPGEPSDHVFAGSREQSSSSIWAIHIEGDQVWLGTFGGGLLQLDRSGEIQTRITQAEGLPNNVIYRILRDPEGRMWLSTNQGLGIVDVRSGRVQQLGRRDGLTNQEFNSGAAWKGRGGKLYFGGVEGVDSVDTATFSFESPAAHPVIDGLTIAHREIGVLDPFSGLDASLPYAGELRLDHRQNIFALRMVALDFNAPSAARLRYRVENLHEEWVQVNGPQAEFSTNYLSPGSYRLRIEAAGRDGQFGNPHVLDIALAPPPWRHPAAYALYGLVFILLLTLIVWRIQRNMHNKRRQVEFLHQQVAERTAELQRLNEKLHRSNLKLDRATRRDPLTGLSNRRDFIGWMETAQESHDQDSRPRLLFLMIDIDDFKQINDKHGHATGDRVLVAFGHRLGAFCRTEDILVRWGGEEFLLVVNNVDPAKGADLARRICQAVSEKPMVTTNGEDVKVTCSVGYAPWPLVELAADPNSWELSIDLADRALYAAKAAGKNCWYGLLAGPQVVGDRRDKPYSTMELQTLIERGILNRVSPSTEE